MPIEEETVAIFTLDEATTLDVITVVLESTGVNLLDPAVALVLLVTLALEDV